MLFIGNITSIFSILDNAVIIKNLILQKIGGCIGDMQTLLIQNMISNGCQEINSFKFQYFLTFYLSFLNKYFGGSHGSAAPTLVGVVTSYLSFVIDHVNEY